ncbi:MAG: tyrosine-type recombinase/integrase [Pseudomonadales bacterium]|nr:tyrosine-type recombinase/integrase [Pseudomonadales bacterium]
MATGKLSDVAIKNAKPKDKPYRLSDGGGMFLEVSPTGPKYWRLAYRFNGKQKLLALGVYPDVGLRQAREKRDDARKLLASGTDPGEARKAEKAKRAGSDTFGSVAEEWMGKNAARWSDQHAALTRNILDVDLSPTLGRMHVNTITAAKVLQALRTTEARGAFYTAQRAKSIANRVMQYAVAIGLAERNPVADLPRGVIESRPVKHHASITDPKKVGQLMRDIRAYEGFFETKCALELLPLVFVRPGELRKAEWSEFNLDGAEWRIPASRMKMGEQHLVPLSKQAVAILRRLHAVTGKRKLLFPGVRHHDKAMSENTLNAALRYMGYDKATMTGHGFRSMASTLLNERGWHRDAIERQLAHAERDKVRASYNYAEHLPERRKMMQAWADYLDKLAAGAEVLQLKSSA